MRERLSAAAAWLMLLGACGAQASPGAEAAPPRPAADVVPTRAAGEGAKAGPAAEAAAPASLLGAWDVERVAVDRGDQPHWNFRPDDPRLLGRELLIEVERVRFNGSKEANCSPPGWKSHTSTWRELIAGGFFRSASSGDTDPRPADYGLKVSPKAAATAHAFCPSAPEAGAKAVSGAWVQEPWVVAEGPNRLVMHLDSQTMLILARRKVGAQPQPSFSCARAGSPAEKTICASVALAAWDRSVALAWRQATENGTSDELMSQQKAWLRIRDACASDATCLEQKMKQRTSALSNR
jgi:uncharacterized protein YecT (DUF1311 family)